MKLAVFGGLYSNYLALQAAVADAQKRGADRLYCLGDMGAFGPHPDRVFPLLRQYGIRCVQGNYDDSIGNALDDCQCGYTDPRDNFFAQLSYEYTLANTNDHNRKWLRDLPADIKDEIQGLRVLFCHGSPRRTNEFLWESTSSTAFLDRLADEYQADLIVGTHSGIHWKRRLSGGRHYVNVGVLGRPQNDGTTHVWYSVITLRKSLTPEIEFVPVEYDYHRLAREMSAECLPDEFIETVLTGWWTTCLEILPAKERRQGRF